MGTLPPTLQEKKLRNICLILEGFEEYYYFKRILEFPCFNGTYNVDIRNAKAASNIPSFFQAAYAKNFYEIVFVVCDKDRNPEQYVNIISKLDDILGPGKAKEIVIFTCPCTLQVILSHFGDVQLTTQAKKAARDDVQRLTDVANYTQFKRLWQYIVTRTVKERSYYRYEDGKRVKHTVTPVLGEKAAHNGKVVYSLDFEVTPHQLRHTYITTGT